MLTIMINFLFISSLHLCRYAEYRQLTVRVYSLLTSEELQQVEALFRLQPLLLKDGRDSLESRVISFRDMLYKLAKQDLGEEPPKSTLEWRKLCAASVGRSPDRAVSVLHESARV